VCDRKSSKGTLLTWTDLSQAVGQCCPLWAINSVALTIFFSAAGLVALPVQNSQIGTICALYGDAERALDSLIAEAGRLPQTNERRDVINMLTGYATLLHTFKDADRLRASMLGVPVTWGLIKTLFITFFTLAVGLWSILRGLGVSATMQSVCPTV
jgi:hypothetical protein